MAKLRTIFGFSGERLTTEEIDFFRDAQPWGFILFDRNVSSPNQLKSLTASLRALMAQNDLPILIDQEGGRVARLKGPHWRHPPAAREFGRLYAVDQEAALHACRTNSRLIGRELRSSGVTVDCLPVLDLPAAGSHDVIGTRAYGETVEQVIALGSAAAEGLVQAGVLPVMKHVPGHGRAAGDSHLELPRISATHNEMSQTDFLPFKALADLPLAMTAHLVYEDIDPELPATFSTKVIENVIRGEIGFDGLLMTDDLSMKALSGSFRTRTERALKAGCDLVLHCNGDMGEMKAVAEGASSLEGTAKRRADAALGRLQNQVEAFDVAQSEALVNDLLSRAAG